MTLVQLETATHTPTDPLALMALCASAIADRHEELRLQDRKDDAEAVRLAERDATAVFGPEAAAALGSWSPAPMMDEDTLQACLTITAGAYLTHTAHCDDGSWFVLLVNCAKCHKSTETRVTSLLGLATALQEAGAL
ncbi:hypothetical protein [Streptomyces sp. NPDC056707]|uniref:hypothetical protein n=1 Tax=Streptomyces sp. NPDC056707 TaxID=3345919 RepID=UPI0036AA54A6